MTVSSTHPDERDVGPFSRWGEPAGRLCTCRQMMTQADRSVHFICEPPQVHVTWRCACGLIEQWAYEDTYDPATGKPVPARRWQRT